MRCGVFVDHGGILPGQAGTTADDHGITADDHRRVIGFLPIGN